MNLRTRFALTMTACVVLLYSGTSWIVYSLARRAGLEHLDERTSKVLEELAADIDWNEDGLDLDFHFKSLPEFGENSRAAFYELRDHEAKVIVRSHSLRPGESLPVFNQEIGTEIMRTIQLPGGGRARAIGCTFRPLLDEDTDPGDHAAPPFDSPQNTLHLSVATSTDGVEQHLQDVSGALMLGGVFLLIACAVVSTVAAHWLHKPIERIAREVAGIDATSLGQQLSVAGTPGEMHPIINQFNALLERLSATMQRERRFSSAIAHELRTPLAELQSLADVALIETPDDATLREEPRDVYAQTAVIASRMGNLLDLLAIIHRREDGRASMQFKDVNLNRLVTDVTDVMRDTIKDSGRTLKVTLPDTPVVVLGHVNVTGAIVTNLLRNALQHADESSPVEVMVTSSPQAITVSNLTTSLTAGDMPMLSEPLWQKDESRTSREQFGIGLTLCRAYADLLGARLLFNLNDKVFTVRVEFREKPVIDPIPLK